ncbi:lipocalin-like domain-containing protein [Prevotella dentasini]|uniref:lipocalin-like domain-containing protein n=1 Tax=Prevotella dentasini TaxID=589537 RepID=UPI0005614A9E|nr:lipocalin-like domain-containing protein [Prevotella dentasini]
MKLGKLRILLLFLPLVVLLLSSCSLETDNDAEELEGMWHLTKIEYVAESSETPADPVDLSRQHIFWSFQGRLLELDDKGGPNRSYLYRFSLNGDKLALTDPYIFDRTSGDRPLEAYEPALANYGITVLTPVLTVGSVNSSKLMLDGGTVRLYFTKF